MPLPRGEGKVKKMSEKLIVMVKLGMDLYAKAKHSSEIIPVPEKGKRYECCGMTTSLVADFEPHRDGYRISTVNSTYLFYSDTMENIEIFADDNCLPEMRELANDCFYWGCYSRMSTYVR